MLKEIGARLVQGYRTNKFPKQRPVLPERYRGLPKIDQQLCKSGCEECVAACPTDAITHTIDQGLKLDLGRCLFCTVCTETCPTHAVTFTNQFELAARKRSDLVLGPDGLKLAQAVDRKARRIFGHSLRLRQVSAGGCNGCEADTNVLGTLAFDIGRFGIQFVASPRHADGILITGPVTQNMKLALEKTYAAVPHPKFVICVGACAISGGPYVDHSEANNGADNIVPVDLYIPGCPPHPMTILDGILRLLGRIK